MDSNGFGSDTERVAFLKAHRGIITRIAERLGMSVAAVSRTYHGITKEVNPRIVEALQQTIANVQRRNTR